ncbi:MAG: type IV pili methyl-accepting chemotaxis transducer N-terminal domain-containing protein [Methylotenera sp.]|uniref:type IV pili methyl-accepting chemotaxis transducer N-terminal domain-containing protein n=1 Tax=Methylotenera sp. TaxID=2051956 RepID=UPI00271FDAE4|nr:type IV pili methyl-accepting chemotaxis transducer N-terminal domain-containing protein [Methylotenera sp.]MDO9204290.1 type IV pili methyl-accepting chemotaxis transducer N-terminal domain-containing protein [Methylotenera sp.]MDO9394623.1 type IV pili methyl-accepting chemotaxis transducer N-terminal domain-containing protein [Methylotenera sp.]MDP2229868.1 type IV pili methyl-accepting chemotaxis transducer N-terminal domain-containing protein [Methylotenera sp.]MDP3141690.1 type IV pili
MIRLKIRDKIIGLLVFYFLVALVAIGSTLLVSWRLEGGAAAINDAGRERMRSYRIAYLLEQQVKQPTKQLRDDIDHEVVLFERTLSELELGNPQRPLSLPKDIDVKTHMTQLRQAWQTSIHPYIMQILNTASIAEQEAQLIQYRPMLEQFVSGINDLVSMVERSNEHATSLLRFLQIALVSLALVGTVLLVYLFSHMVVRPVTQLREGIQRMAQADFDVRLPVTSHDELGELASGFNRMADQLQDIYATLEQRVEEKTRSIEAKNKELAALDKEMAVSEERNLLAQELHDSIAQSLAFLNIQVQLLQEDLQKNHIAEAMKGLAQIREGVQESYDDVRELLVHFRTRIGSTDLETAIRSALDKFEGQTGIKATFSTHGSAPKLQPEQVLQVMHIVQESLSNVRKHAKASQVEVEIVCAEQCTIDIRDNGVGFDAARDTGDSHVGLLIMRERAHRIGAALSFDSVPSVGTHISLILPKDLH